LGFEACGKLAFGVLNIGFLNFGFLAFGAMNFGKMTWYLISVFYHVIPQNCYIHDWIFSAQ